MEFIELVLKVKEILFAVSLQTREGNLQPDLPDLTLKQFYYLDIIDKMDKPTFGELAERLKVSKPAVTAIVNRLADLKCVSKVQCNDDRRVYYLIVDEVGKRIIDQNYATAREYAKHIESCLTPEELAKYSEMLNRVISSYTLKKA